MTTVTRQIVESHPYPRDFEANLRRAGVTIEETGETALRARVAQLEAWLNERYSGIEAELNKCEALRARVAKLEAALRLARPYIVQATEGMDPPAPALTVLDAALAQEDEK